MSFRSLVLGFAKPKSGENEVFTFGVKDPATNDISAKGWCRLMGLTPIALFTACLFIVRNVRVADAFDARKAEQARRRACGLPARKRRRRRGTLHDLLAEANAPPA